MSARHKLYVFRGVSGLSSQCELEGARAAWSLAWRMARLHASLQTTAELAGRSSEPARIRVQCDGWLVYTLHAHGGIVEIDDHRKISKWALPALLAGAKLCCVRLP